MDIPGFKDGKVISGSFFKWKGKLTLSSKYSTGTVFEIRPGKDSDHVSIFLHNEPVMLSYWAYYLSDPYYWEYFGPPGELSPTTILPAVSSTPPPHPFGRLPIPYERQDRVSYRLLERYARNSEEESSKFLKQSHPAAVDQCLQMAKHWRHEAKLAMPLDEGMEIEEKALDAGNILSIEAYREMGSGDKILWELRGLEKFIHYTQFSGVYYWYE